MRLPDLSGRPAIVHFFLGVLTLVPHLGHFAIQFLSINQRFMVFWRCWINNFPLFFHRKQRPKHHVYTFLAQ
jgi:hypothetical protein